MTTEGPYTYPLTGRADIIAFLGEHDYYWPMNSNNGGFVLSWNIKTHYTIDTSGAAYAAGFGFEARLDEAWADEVEADDQMFWDVCVDALRMYTEGGWTRYPGLERGMWQFGINGRTGGWLMLRDWPGRKPNRWACFPMVWHDRDDYKDWLGEFEAGELEMFYKAVVQLDQELSRDSCREAIEYGYACRRGLWEEAQRAEEEGVARLLEGLRPHMYPQED